MDRLYLNEIRCYGYTGALPEEQVLGQWFEVDLVLSLDLSQAGESDRLEHTLDYRQVITLVRELVETSRFSLLERLATAIAMAILQIPSVSQVTVRLTKPNAPIPNFGGKITLELTREKT